MTTLIPKFDRRIRAEKALSTALEPYAGSWVAVQGHRVVADAPTAEELLEKTQGQAVERRFRVSESGSAFL